MVKLLIIADDFTGALDTGVQFAARGAATSVITDPAFDFAGADDGLQVLVMDAATRHLRPEQAYSVVRKAAEHALAFSWADVCSVGNVFYRDRLLHVLVDPCEHLLQTRF